jgi:hypothetical protein
MDTGTVKVGRKKSPIRMGTVKIELTLIRKAKTVAEDKGLNLAEYLSDVLRGTVERDWLRIVQRPIGREGGQE